MRDPDHHDYQILENNINKQVVINRLINKNINKLTNVTNTILKITQNSDEIINQKATILKYIQ